MTCLQSTNTARAHSSRKKRNHGKQLWRVSCHKRVVFTSLATPPPKKPAERPSKRVLWTELRWITLAAARSMLTTARSCAPTRVVTACLSTNFTKYFTNSSLALLSAVSANPASVRVRSRPTPPHLKICFALKNSNFPPPNSVSVNWLTSGTTHRPRSTTALRTNPAATTLFTPTT